MKHHDLYLHFLITSEVEYISILAFSCTLPGPLFYDFNWLLSIWYLLSLNVSYLCILCAVRCSKWDLNRNVPTMCQTLVLMPGR